MNVWKILFILLLLFNIGVVLYIYVNLSGDYDVPESDSEGFMASGIEVVLDNATIENLLDENINDNSLSIHVNEDGIKLYSNNYIYGNTVYTSFNLEPISYGDVVTFRVSNIDISGFPLSQDMLYTLILENSNLPEGIYFSREQYALIFDTSLLTNQLAFQNLDLVNIDYQNNAWYFTIRQY